MIINVVEAVRIGSSEGVEEKGEEGEAWDFADSSLFQVDGSVRVLSEVRATRRNDAVSIGQADGAEVNEVGDQRLRDDVVYSKTSLEDANKESLVICRYGRVPYRDSVGNRVLVHLRVLLYPLGVGLSLN